MSLYALIGLDRPDSLALRMSVRAEHLARVRQLADEGRIAIAGPFPAVDADEPTAAGFTGRPGGLTVRLVDSTATGLTNGRTVNVTTNGGTTPYSAATVVLGTSVTAVGATE